MESLVKMMGNGGNFPGIRLPEMAHPIAAREHIANQQAIDALVDLILTGSGYINLEVENGGFSIILDEKEVREAIFKRRSEDPDIPIYLTVANNYMGPGRNYLPELEETGVIINPIPEIHDYPPGYDPILSGSVQIKRS